MWRDYWIYYRKLLKVSIKDVSDKTGISYTTILRYEHKESDISVEKLEKMFKTIGISVIFTIDINNKITLLQNESDSK